MNFYKKRFIRKFGHKTTKYFNLGEIVNNNLKVKDKGSQTQH